MHCVHGTRHAFDIGGCSGAFQWPTDSQRPSVASQSCVDYCELQIFYERSRCAANFVFVIAVVQLK